MKDVGDYIAEPVRVSVSDLTIYSACPFGVEKLGKQAVEILDGLAVIGLDVEVCCAGICHSVDVFELNLLYCFP